MNKLVFSAVFLVFLLSVGWILNDFGIISLSFGPQHITPSQDVGKLAKKIKNVQRRGKESLAWEDVAQDDKVFNYDSVITLSNSQAFLKMNEGVELNMEENTLITITPPRDQLDALTLNLMAGSYKVSLAKGKKIKVSKVIFVATEDSSLVFKSGKDSQIHMTVASGAVDVSSHQGSNDTNGAPVGVVKSGQGVTIDDSRKVTTISQPVAKVEPVPTTPPVSQKVKQKVARLKLKVRKIPISKGSKSIVQKRNVPIDGSHQEESMDKRADPEAMSQELEELPGN